MPIFKQRWLLSPLHPKNQKNNTNIDAQLAQLKQQYEQVCATLRIGLYGEPWLLNPRLEERGEQYDADVKRLLAQARFMDRILIEQTAESGVTHE